MSRDDEGRTKVTVTIGSITKEIEIDTVLAAPDENAPYSEELFTNLMVLDLDIFFKNVSGKLEVSDFYLSD